MVITLDFESSNPGSNPGRTYTHRSSVGRAGDCNIVVLVIPRSLVRIRSVRDFGNRIFCWVEWPSGLRRQVKALISSESRVRIPSQPIKKKIAHLAQKVERWPFKPMVVGSIPTVGVFLQSVGFEPTHPKILRPERSALDRSAKIA